MHPDIVVTLPEGWRELDNKGGPLTYSPDDGVSVLQISAPAELARLREHELEEMVPTIAKIVEGTGIGHVVYKKIIDTNYGRAVFAKIYMKPCTYAWVVVPKTHPPLFITYIAEMPFDFDDAQKIVETLKPGRFSIALAIAAENANPEIAPHALLVADGTVRTMNLGKMPPPVWDDACRHARAQSNAEVVVQVVAGEELAVIYAESKDRHRRVVVKDGITHEVGDARRLDLFRACDPTVAAAFVTR